MIGVRRSMSMMATKFREGLPLQEIILRLEKFASSSLAESWDNVGLLVNPMSCKPICSTLLTNDLTEDVVEEAIKIKAGLIISYHPNIFRPFKSVSDRTWKERIIVQCIKNNIAVYSPHTSWDAVKGGVNDWLADAFTYESSRPITPSEGDATIGSGRLLTLTQPLAVGVVVNLVKKHIGMPHLRLALARQKDQASTIRTIALCAGSGASVLTNVVADLYLTGEMLHHDILDCTQRGIHVILCNHSDSERGFLKIFQYKLKQEILNDNVEVVVSQNDQDPLTTV